MLVLVRVDCRLIHGQIIEAWVPFTRADTLLVANDDVANDTLQRSIMEMAVPPRLKVVALSVADAVQQIMAGKFAGQRVILLFASCEDAANAWRLGLRSDRLNLGNLVCAPDKTQVTCSLAFNTSDLACLQEIQDQGAWIEARSVPRDHSKNLQDIVASCTAF